MAEALCNWVVHCPSFVCQLYVSYLFITCPLSVIYFVCCDVSVLNETFAEKLGTNIHQVSVHCWRSYQGQRSRLQQDQVHFCGSCIHFDDVVLQLTCVEAYTHFCCWNLLVSLASCLSYALKWASANFVDSLCQFRHSFGCVLLLNQIFLTMYRSIIYHSSLSDQSALEITIQYNRGLRNSLYLSHAKKSRLIDWLIEYNTM